MNPCVIDFPKASYVASERPHVSARLKAHSVLDSSPDSSLDSQRAVAMSQASKDNLLSPDNMALWTLPPFVVAKAWAFETVLKHMEKHLGKSTWMLISEEKTKFIAKHLQLKGGGQPGSTAVINAIAKCKQPGWNPGKVHGQRRGR